MPPVYAIISFFSYKFFREYTYYELIEAAYEAVTLSAFILLLIEYVASTASEHDVDKAMARKAKSNLPIPFCCWRYRPSKAYFMYTVKWSVLQYVIIRPAVSIAGIVCERYNVLCPDESFDPRYAQVYLSAVDFASITVALYGLILFYGLTKDELTGKRPLAKFLAIKLIVMATFYQSFIFDLLEGRVIHATEYWTETNIADGLNALTTCIEMVFFAAFMMWAYTWNEYVVSGYEKTSIWKPLWDSINYTDFAVEIWGSLKFYFDYSRKKPGTHGPSRLDGEGYNTNPNIAGPGRKMNFGEAFGVDKSRRPGKKAGIIPMSRASYDENIRLAPYGYQRDAGVVGSDG